jgi:hypothetical protein
MDNHYVPIYRQAAKLQHQFHDYTHATAYDPTATLIRNEIHHLTNDLANNKNPRTIESRVRTIQTQLQRTQMLNPTPGANNQPILNMNQTHMLHQNFESLRRNIRQSPHY